MVLNLGSFIEGSVISRTSKWFDHMPATGSHLCAHERIQYENTRERHPIQQRHQSWNMNEHDRSSYTIVFKAKST